MQSYDASEWKSRAVFIPLLRDACDRVGASLAWFSDEWIARITRGNATSLVSGYTFTLNNAASADCIRDKVTTATLLADAGVPVIAHSLLRLSAARELPAVNEVVRLAPLPLVVKPAAAESGGHDVLRCTTEQEVSEALTELAKRHRSLAVCPYVEIAQELRVVMLDGEARLVFEKLRQPGEWRHNLKLGATPRVVTAPPEVIALAQHTMQVLDGRIAAVDIAHTPDGYKIMEVNGAITLDRFSMHSPEYHQMAVDVYAEIVEKSLAA